jgi:O-antigen ligase
MSSSGGLSMRACTGASNDGTVQAWITRGAWLEGMQSLALGLAVVALFVSNDLQPSNGFVVVWLLLGLLAKSAARPWSFVMIGLVVLNLRWIVLDEGPLPVSPIDYVLMLAAFACGFARPSTWWRRQVSVLALATLVGVLLQLEIVVDFARFGIEYHAAALTKNQTALLAGLASLCSLIGALTSRVPWSRLLHAVALVAALFLLRAADSRAGVGMVCLAVLLAGVVAYGPLLAAGWRQRFGGLRRLLLIAAILLAGLWLIHQLTAMVGLDGAGIAKVYGEENLENDAARLKLWGCYLGIPFSGSNRFIWGIGYERAWRLLCTAESVGRQLSHAHNLFLQVWGENGISGFLFLISWIGWTLSRIIRNCRQQVQANQRLFIFSSCALVTYLLGFNLFELGMIKVPLFMVSFGLFLATPFSIHTASHFNRGPQASLGPAGIAD